MVGFQTYRFENKPSIIAIENWLIFFNSGLVFTFEYLITCDAQSTKNALMQIADNAGPNQPALIKWACILAQADQDLHCPLNE